MGTSGAPGGRALAHLAGGHADHTWHKRLAELARPAVLILDDFAMRELTVAQADDLYEPISERAGRSLVLTSNRAPQDWYPLFPKPVVAESLLDDNADHLFGPRGSWPRSGVLLVGTEPAAPLLEHRALHRSRPQTWLRIQGLGILLPR
jgi:hypothetical protein